MGRPTLARLCERVHKKTSLMSSSLLLQQCCSSNLDGLGDGRQVAVQLLFCGVLLPGFAQYSSCTNSQQSHVKTLPSLKAFVEAIQKHVRSD